MNPCTQIDVLLSTSVFWPTCEKNLEIDPTNGSGVTKTKFAYVFSGKYPIPPSTDNYKEQVLGGSFMDKICPFPNSNEQNAYIAMIQSEKEIVEAIIEHSSFE